MTPNVCHVATKTHALQEHVHHGKVVHTRISTTMNRSDHFTKALPYSSLQTHCKTMMGYGFIDSVHRQATHILQEQWKAIES